MRDEDIKYINELEKRVQELEEQNQGLHIMYDVRLAKFDKLEKQNKRYREGREILDQVYKDSYVRNSYGYEDGYLDGLDTAMSIIDEALEGESE